jgi:4-hydroxy 2-oxovalerate aldolase
MARIATHCTEADIALQHIEYSKSLGLETIGFLMMSHMTSPQELAFQAKLMERYGADCVYVTDSAGALLTDDYRARVEALKEAIDIPVGIHAHNNLGCAVANSLVGVQAGATYVDGCCAGLGAGAGNAPLEALAAAFLRAGIDIGGVDLFKLVEAVETAVRPVMARPTILDGASLMLGYAGVYSSFLLHAERAAKRFNVDVRAILLECGERKLVGGQEDTMIEIAQELSMNARA